MLYSGVAGCRFAGCCLPFSRVFGEQGNRRHDIANLLSLPCITAVRDGDSVCLSVCMCFCVYVCTMYIITGVTRTCTLASQAAAGR